MTLTFVDGIDKCEALGHEYVPDTPWVECAFGLYVKYEKCTKCKGLKRYMQYKWMGINETEL